MFKNKYKRIGKQVKRTERWAYKLKYLDKRGTISKTFI